MQTFITHVTAVCLCLIMSVLPAHSACWGSSCEDVRTYRYGVSDGVAVESAASFNIEISMYFATGVAALDLRQEDKLVEMIEVWGSQCRGPLYIEGFADSRGSAARNASLAAERVGNIQQIVSDLGLEQLQVFTRVVGEVKSRVLAQARRVDVTYGNCEARK
jgi:outer membrane protein OmpA-like peptidoglycan-associated protein